MPGICAVSPPIKAQPAARQALRETGQQLIENARLESFRANVIEKEQRARAEDRDVVDAMIDQIGADGVVPVHGKRDLQFRADAIDARDQTGSRIPEKFGANKPPNPPMFPSTSGPCVLLTRAWMRRLTRLPRSTSTPASA